MTAPPALLIIDVQKAIDDPSWGDDRNNPAAEQTIAALLEKWRSAGWPLFHIRHASREPRSTYRRGGAGFDFKPEVAPIDGERVIEKETNSAFIRTSLERESPRPRNHGARDHGRDHEQLRRGDRPDGRQPRLRHVRRFRCHRDIRQARFRRAVADIRRGPRHVAGEPQRRVRHDRLRGRVGRALLRERAAIMSA